MTNPIHIKLEYIEAVQSKKDVLYCEIALLKIAKSIKAYKSLRSEELKTKLRLHRKLRELKTNIGQLRQTLPRIKIPEILLEKKEEEKKEGKEKIPKIKEKIYDDSLEIELREIQNRLRELG